MHRKDKLEERSLHFMFGRKNFQFEKIAQNG